MGQMSASRVVTSTQRVGKPKQIKPVNTEWVTLLQGGCADGSAIPPFLVFKGKLLNNRWFQQGLPSNWKLTTSQNGWTTNEVTVQFIQHFEQYTKAKTLGSKRLLVLDNHESHTTAEFREFCKEHNIILLWMLPHTSHLLQPMDVGCFGPLKAMYGKQNQFLIRNHIFHIRKEDFLDSFHKAYLQAINYNNQDSLLPVSMPLNRDGPRASQTASSQPERCQIILETDERLRERGCHPPSQGLPQGLSSTQKGSKCYNIKLKEQKENTDTQRNTLTLTDDIQKALATYQACKIPEVQSILPLLQRAHTSLLHQAHGQNIS